MGVDVKYTYRDKGLDRIGRDLKELGELSVVVGIVGAKAIMQHPESDVSVATVAMFNEFGTATSPERSFIRSALREGQAEIARKYQQQMTLVVMGKRSPLRALEECGRLGARLVKQKLDAASAWAVPLSLATIKAKGSNVPLRDTDTVREAIGYAVRRGGPRGPTLAEGYAA